MERRPSFPELSATMDRVWADREDLASADIHLLASRYDEREGRWIEFEVVTKDAVAARRILRERYSDLIRLAVIGSSLTEDVVTAWDSYRTDASERTIYVRYATSGYHRGARAEVAENAESVTITLIETRWVGAYGPAGMHNEQAARLQTPLGGRPVIDAARAARDGDAV